MSISIFGTVPVGVEGPRGPRGFMGETGPKGDKGDPGISQVVKFVTMDSITNKLNVKKTTGEGGETLVELSVGDGSAEYYTLTSFDVNVTPGLKLVTFFVRSMGKTNSHPSNIDVYCNYQTQNPSSNLLNKLGNVKPEDYQDLKYRIFYSVVEIISASKTFTLDFKANAKSLLNSLFVRIEDLASIADVVE